MLTSKTKQKEDRDDLTKLLKEDPENVEALYKRGLLNYSLKEYKEARDDFTKVIENDAMHAGAFDNRSLCNMMLGNISESGKDFKTFEKLKKSAQSKG